MLPPTWAFRHDELFIPRPYGIDVDHDEWLWEGCSTELVAHNLRTAELKRLTIPEMGGYVAYQTFCWDGKVIITLALGPWYVVYEPATGKAVRVPIKGEKPITWYGTKVQVSGKQKLYLYERGHRQLLILDAPDAPPRYVQCPYTCDFASGSQHGDGLVYTFAADPHRTIRFDPVSEKFIDEKPTPFPEVAISGRFDHKGILYGADSAGGRLLPLDLKTQQWLDPIATPDFKRVYGFIGGGFSFQCKGYFCLSTYANRSRLDTKTGKIIIGPGPISVDGKPNRFMEKFIVFDPETRGFDYLEAPRQPDGVPLLCYPWTDGKRFAITGLVQPYTAPGDVLPEQGYYFILQSVPADLEPGFGRPSMKENRYTQMAKYRRTYPRNRSLFQPYEPHVPTITNMRGPGPQYPVGDSQRLLRRAAKTDAARYWKETAEQIVLPGDDAKTRATKILRHVQHRNFYNPIAEPDGGNPIACHEAHDVRCGVAVAITLELFKAADVEGRLVNLANHCAAEAKYDGTWHYADALFFGASQPERDGRVLSAEELVADKYFADAWPQWCFAYDPELTTSVDGFQVLGYVFGIWGSEPFYSFYLGATRDHPPTLPFGLPAQRVGNTAVRLNWCRSIKLNRGDDAIEYDCRVFTERDCRPESQVFHQLTRSTSAIFEAPDANRMYYVEVRALDDHRTLNPKTWYPPTRWNFVVTPPEQYGWYGML